MMSSKKKIVLHRKLPAAIHLTATAFAVKTTARDNAQADVAQSLSEILETELLKNDSKLHAEAKSPEFVISCSITHFEIPAPQTFTRNEVVLEKGHSIQEPRKYYKVKGALEVAYQVKDTRSGKVLDSDNLSAKYSKDFEEGRVFGTTDAHRTPTNLNPSGCFANRDDLGQHRRERGSLSRARQTG